MNRLIQYIIISSLSCLLASTAFGVSLWDDDCSSLFVDTKAHAVGDLLTVTILQQSTSTTTAKHATSKSTDASVNPGTGLLSGLSGFSLKAGRNTNGSGASANNTSFDDEITVMITEVLPNGNFRICGKRDMLLEKDKISLEFTGIVRPEDIAPDNTICSLAVAEMSLVAKGAGPIAEKSRPGIISTVLSWLW